MFTYEIIGYSFIVGKSLFVVHLSICAREPKAMLLKRALFARTLLKAVRLTLVSSARSIAITVVMSRAWRLFKK